MKFSLLLIAVLVPSCAALFKPIPPAPPLGPNLTVQDSGVAVAFPKNGFSARIGPPNERYLVRVREADRFGSVDFFEKTQVAYGAEPGPQAQPNISFYFLEADVRSIEEWVRASNAKVHTLSTIRDDSDGRGGHELMTTIYVPGHNGRKDFRYLRLIKLDDTYFECGGSSGGELLAKQAEAFCASFAPNT